MNKTLRTALIVLVVGFAAWFGYTAVSGYLRDPYSGINEVSFIDGCTKGGGTKPQCQCAFNWMEQNVPKDEVIAFDKAARQPGFSPATAPPWFLQAVRTCAGAR